MKKGLCVIACLFVATVASANSTCDKLKKQSTSEKELREVALVINAKLEKVLNDNANAEENCSSELNKLTYDVVDEVFCFEKAVAKNYQIDKLRASRIYGEEYKRSHKIVNFATERFNLESPLASGGNTCYENSEENLKLIKSITPEIGLLFLFI